MLGPSMQKHSLWLRFLAFVVVSVSTLPFFVAGIVLALIASVKLFGLTLQQLHQPASLSWISVFLLLVCVFIAFFSLVGYGLLVFVLHRFSANQLLRVLAPQDSHIGSMSRMYRWVYHLAARLGAPSGV